MHTNNNINKNERKWNTKGKEDKSDGKKRKTRNNKLNTNNRKRLEEKFWRKRGVTFLHK